MNQRNIHSLRILGVFVLLMAIGVQADTIYLKSGRTIKADKAWEENDRIQYQIGDNVLSMPKSVVDRIATDSTQPDNSKQPDSPSVAPPPAKSGSEEISGPRGSRKIYFVPLGQFPESDLRELVAYCEGRFHIKINVLHAVPIDDAAVDKDRQQLISEELTAGMQRALPELARDPDALLIGFTNADMYPQSQGWRFAFGWRSEGTAVVSTARMNFHYIGEPVRVATLQVRLRKVVVKDIGIMYYILSQSDDPKSVLYRGVAGIEELDEQTESF